MRYLYRDASNYKANNAVVLAGTITQKQEQAPTINMTVTELVSKFGEVDGCWNNVWVSIYEGL